jgi:hypothetical protein
MRFLQLFYMPVISLGTMSVIMGLSEEETGQEAVSGKGAMTRWTRRIVETGGVSVSRQGWLCVPPLF